MFRLVSSLADVIPAQHTLATPKLPRRCGRAGERNAPPLEQLEFRFPLGPTHTLEENLQCAGSLASEERQPATCQTAIGMERVCSAHCALNVTLARSFAIEEAEINNQSRKPLGNASPPGTSGTPPSEWSANLIQACMRSDRASDPSEGGWLQARRDAGPFGQRAHGELA